MEPRLGQEQLFETLQVWNYYLKRKVRLIACGGTAMTLLGVKPSTQDIDFMVPDHTEHAYLVRILEKDLQYRNVTQAGWQRAGEEFRFDLFRGNKIHTTELLQSPLEEGGHTVVKEYSRLFVGVLNDYDLITSKLMRGTRVDFDDCEMLAAAHVGELEIDRLVRHFHETVDYDISQDRIRCNIEHFVERLKEKGLYAAS
jgi:hypothetical protein